MALVTELDQSRHEASHRWRYFLPDGRHFLFLVWSGQPDNTLRSFPGPGVRSQISTTSGWQARWRKDGKEIFYLAPGPKLMTVELKDNTAFRFGVPKLLFDLSLPGFAGEYAAAANGQGFS